MKSFAFTLALIAAVNAVDIESVGYGGYGHGYQTYTYPKTTTEETKADTKATASKAYGAEAKGASASDWDAWGRDQDLSISESYGKTNAKSYAAESYDEWDNKDNDKWGAQAWGKDRDVYGASSYGKAASSADADRYGYGGQATGHKGYGGAAAQKWQGASAAHGAAQGGYDNDVWAKQAYGSDQDSRWGKSYDSVDAKSYDGEWYARSVKADDDQWAEDYDRYDAGNADSNGNAASSQEWRKPVAGKHGKGGQPGGEFGAASQGQAAGYWGKSGSDWDAWGRDQDYSEDVSYDKVQAKAYSAESYDEWDNKDDDKWGAQAWGKDRDVYGASSYGRAASAQDWQGAQAGAKNAYGASHGKGHGHVGYAKGAQAGYGAGNRDWQGASRASQAAAGAYDNDEWAKQAYGSDYDSRWGKSYDSVSAKSYDNESYARAVQADDDQWAEDYDRYDARDANSRANAASAWGKESDSKFGPTYNKGGYGGYGKSYTQGVNKGAVYDSASKDGKQDYAGKSGSDWDAWGRDQDLSIKESYDRTWAKSYDAESYDEWDNTDDDKWGAQAWGKDRDQYGASSQDYAASQGDMNGYGRAYGGAKAYGGHQAGHGYGKAQSYGGKAGYGGQAYGANNERDASKAWGAQKSGYDNDEWAKQAYGVDTDSRWGKSYDSVAAKSYDDEQYARKIWADDDQWAEDYDRYNTRAADSHSKAASANDERGAKTTHTVTPVTVKYGGYGGYGGHGSRGGYGGHGAHGSYGQNSYGKW